MRSPTSRTHTPIFDRVAARLRSRDGHDDERSPCPPPVSPSPTGGTLPTSPHPGRRCAICGRPPGASRPRSSSPRCSGLAYAASRGFRPRAEPTPRPSRPNGRRQIHRELAATIIGRPVTPRHVAIFIDGNRETSRRFPVSMPTRSDEGGNGPGRPGVPTASVTPRSDPIGERRCPCRAPCASAGNAITMYLGAAERRSHMHRTACPENRPFVVPDITISFLANSNRRSGRAVFGWHDPVPLSETDEIRVTIPALAGEVTAA
jgi:hypothetical protein